MILPFSTQLNGKPTYFVEKILASLIAHSKSTNNQLLLADIMRFAYRYSEFFKVDYEQFLSKIKEVKPKHHTMREDSKDRWNDNCLVHFFINIRTKLRFLFAPVLPVVSTQKVSIFWATKYMVIVEVDDKYIGNAIWDRSFLGMSCDLKVRELSKNDGFDTIEDFFAYFKEDFRGKIIHWTDLRY
jgi:hypothetical protein